MLNDPDFNSEFNRLIDLTELTSLDFSVDEAKIVARHILFSPTSRRAIASPNPAIFGMGRLMQAYNEMSDTASEVHIFHDLPSALKWLSVKSLPK